MADDVSVRFGAQIDGLLSGVQQAKEQIASITEPIAGVMDAFRGIGEALSAAFALDKIGEFERQFADLGEQIARTSKITGESTDNVQLFTTAIKLSGGDAETAAMTLNILQKNIGDAISKAGPARAAFEGMGFSLEQLKNTDIVTLLFEMKQRMEEAGTSAEQSALKMEYMRAVAGRSGAQFLALKDSLDEVKKVVEEAGSSMSPAMVKDADQLSDHIHILDLAWQGLKNTIADAASGMADSFVKSATKATEVINTNISAFGLATDALRKYNEELAQKNGAWSGSSGTSGQGGWEGSSGAIGPAKNYGVQFGPQGQNPLPPLEDGAGSGTDDADKVQEQIERSNYQASLEVDKLKLQSRKDTDQAMVDSGQMSASQQIADLQKLAADEYAIEIQAVDKLASTYDEDSAEYAALQDKKLVLAQQYTNEVAKLNEQLAAAQKKQYEAELAPWKQLLGDMGSAFDTWTNGIISGTQTLSQATARAFSDLEVKFAEVLAKMTAEYLAFEATGGKGILGFGATNPFAALGGIGGAASGGTGAAGAAAQAAALTANTAALTAGTVATTGSTVATTANTTTTATTGAQGLLATIENTTATLANTIALDAQKVASFIGGLLPSFDVGSWSVPSDMVAQIHQGEMIIPEGPAAALRSGGSIGSSAGAGASGGQFTINVNAIDTQTGAQFLKSNASVIAQTLALQMRNGNSSLSSAVRS